MLKNLITDLANEPFLIPTLFVYKITPLKEKDSSSRRRKLSHTIKFIYKVDSDNYAKTHPIDRSRLNRSLSINEAGDLNLVSIDSKLFLIKTNFKKLAKAENAIIVQNIVSSAFRIRNAALYRNFIYFTLSDECGCYTMLNKISFSPNLLLDKTAHINPPTRTGETN